MENEVVQPNSAQMPVDVDLPLDAYRAQRDGKTPAAEAKPEVPAKAAAASVALEPGDPTVEEPGEEDNPEQRKKKLGGFQKKIARQEAELAELRKRLDVQPSGTPAAPAAAPAPAPIAAFPKPKPTLEDSDGIEDFAEKLTDWKIEERDWRKEQTTVAAKQADTAKTLVDGWNTRKAAFLSDGHDDWDDAMAAVKDIKLSPAHQQIFLESDHGPELAYLLANDRDELERIAKLPPLAAAREIGKLETRFAKTDAEEDAPVKPEIKVSNAPRPFKPLSGSNGRGTPNVANMDLADYRKAREAGRV